jgi:hypothetical protein
MIKKIITNSHNLLTNQLVVAFLYNSLLAMIVFMLSRIFFFLVNRSYFPDVATARLLTLLKGGLVFYISYLLYINSIYMTIQLFPFRFRLNKTYQTITKWIFIITNGAALIINCMDIPLLVLEAGMAIIRDRLR